MSKTECCIKPLLITILLCLPLLRAQCQQELLTMDHVMTSEEAKASGISSLSPAQRLELDHWLNRHTLRLISEKKSGSCSPAIETQIEGDFQGCNGDTIYKLRNGQIWQQASYHHHYHYAYAPDVTIYSSSDGCSMRVADDDDKPISVRRLK
jgi:hypothetical protein